MAEDVFAVEVTGAVPWVRLVESIDLPRVPVLRESLSSSSSSEGGRLSRLILRRRLVICSQVSASLCLELVGHTLLDKTYPAPNTTNQAQCISGHKIPFGTRCGW